MLRNAKVGADARRRGRPRLELDEGVIARLAARGCSTRAIAEIMDCSEDTMQRNYAALIRCSWVGGKIGLRCAQFELAMKGSARMLIWLGRQYLGQTNNGKRIDDDEPELKPSDDYLTDLYSLARARSAAKAGEVEAPRVHLERAG